MTRFRHSIAFRLFIVTFAAMLLFVGVLLLVLAGGFSTFYEQRQKKDLATELNHIRDMYRPIAQHSSGEVSPAFFGRFESDYSASLSVVTIQGETIKIFSSDMGLTDGGADSGLPGPFPPRLVGGDGFTSVYVVPKGPDSGKAQNLWVQLEGWRQNPQDYRDVMVRGKTVVYGIKGTNEGGGGAQLIAISPLSGDGRGNGQVLFALSSLQPIRHASSVFRDMSLYVFAVAFGVVGLLAVGYASLLTRPLRRLNGIAGRLARLDFSARSGWKRKDELGDLSRTFDFLADNLQSTLAELTSANEKLREDIEKEKRLEKMRREFVAGVSHELKTPLSLIGGYAEGLRDNIGSGAKKERYAEVILEETQRMSAIVADLLDLSHLESGRYELRREQFDAVGLLREAAEEARTLGAAKRQRVKLTLPAEATAGQDAEPDSGSSSVEPDSADLAPADSAPTGPVPADPAATGPAPADSAPANPNPADPAADSKGSPVWITATLMSGPEASADSVRKLPSAVREAAAAASAESHGTGLAAVRPPRGVEPADTPAHSAANAPSASRSKSGEVVSLANADKLGDVVSRANADRPGDVVLRANADRPGEVVSRANADRPGEVVSRANVGKSGEVVSRANADRPGEASSLSVTDAADGVTVVVYGKAAQVPTLLDSRVAETSAGLTETVGTLSKVPGMEPAADNLSSPVIVNADRTRIGQVLTNLVSNAVRHAPEGGLIALGLRIGRDEAEWFVRNEGPAIPDGELDRIWEPFFRGDKARSRDQGGTGIGLAVAKQILELHGGRFGAVNLSDGVEFRFSLKRIF